MRLTVFSGKLCWSSLCSPSGYATDGGFPFQIHALSELFDETVAVVPRTAPRAIGEIPLTGCNLTVVTLTSLRQSGTLRKLKLPLWLVRNWRTMIREVARADAVHVPLPGDLPAIAMLIAFALRKPLFIRYCGNWSAQRTSAERFFKWFMERYATGRNVMLATGGSSQSPSPVNPNVRWIFSTSLTRSQLAACSPSKPDRGRGPKLAIACRQEPGKGTDLVIRAVNLLLSDFPFATLEVIGGGSALSSLKDLAASLDLGSRVTFHGQLAHDRVIEVLRQADLFCYPTASEGFPKVVLEALACGLPVISSRVSVIPSLIGNGSGIVLDEPGPVAVANAVRLCLQNPEEYRKMRNAAVETAQQYSLERWRDTIGEVLRGAWGQLSYKDTAGGCSL